MFAAEYERRNMSSCMVSDLYGSYKNLISAKLGCTTDPKCVAIYDESCDGYGQFLLCKRGFVTTSSASDASKPSCIYKKAIYSGKYFYFTVLLPKICQHICPLNISVTPQ